MVFPSTLRSLIYLIILAITLVNIQEACTPKLERFAYLPNPTTPLNSSPKPFQENECCKDYLSYAPDTNHLDHTPMQYVRVNVHLMNSTSKAHNFDGASGEWFAKQLIKAANHDIETNDRLWLPYGNNIPNLPPRYRLKLTPRPNDPNDNGIYFHYDDELYYYVIKGKNRNRGNNEVIKKYGVQLDTVLNIFVMPHHPDSVASPSYKPSRAGIAMGNAVKVTGAYETGGNEWDVRMVLNHEIGHIYTLAHTWATNDGCEDTPNHMRCWNRTKTPPCDTAASNNMMDYNALQSALSPCQIGKIHYHMNKLNHRSRKFLEPYWCTLDPAKNITIRDSVHWRGRKDLGGHLTIARGASLQISCRVSLPQNARITVEPGGTLILDNCRLHNDCGQQWWGIEVQEQGEQIGKVVEMGQVQLQDMQTLGLETTTKIDSLIRSSIE